MAHNGLCRSIDALLRRTFGATAVRVSAALRRGGGWRGGRLAGNRRLGGARVERPGRARYVGADRVSGQL